MTRLHIQVNQTMQFYRGQQGGSAPQRLFLSGGASLMPYTAQFFAEKLNVPVEYFNPFRNVDIDPSVNLEELARVAHSLGEVVGLGLRNLAHCPVELNLMPESTLNWVQFNQKKPYFIFTAFCLVMVVFASSFIFKQLAGIYRDEYNKLSQEIEQPRHRKELFDKAMKDLKNTKTDAGQYASWMDGRYYWADVLAELHRVLIQVEADTGNKLRTPTGVWIEQFISAQDLQDSSTVMDQTQGQGTFMASSPPLRGGYSPNPMGLNPDGTPAAAPGMAATPGAAAAITNDLSRITIVCRGVDVANISGVPSANQDIAYALERALKDSPLFDKDETQLAGDNNPDPNGTFTFGVKLKLKRPLNL